MSQETPALGLAIFIGTGRATASRYQEEKYRSDYLEHYATRLEQSKYPLTPSTLTSQALIHDWAERRVAIASASSRLPAEDSAYLIGAKFNVDALMNSLIVIRSLAGEPYHWGHIRDIQEKSQMTERQVEGFMAFTDPIRQELTQQMDDRGLLVLLQQAALARQRQPDFHQAAPDSEPVIYSVYRDIYPISEEFLAHREDYKRKHFAYPSNWF